jgi:DNA-binding MarR family transcriptional regulator
MALPVSADDIALPALLRAARAAYANATRFALQVAGYDDIPKNGAYVIGAIGSGHDVPMADIIRGLGITKQAAGQLIDTLVLRGYVERAIDENDRRRLTVTLTTTRGRAAATAIRKAVSGVDAKLKKRAGEKAIVEARKVLFDLIFIANEGQST